MSDTKTDKNTTNFLRNTFPPLIPSPKTRFLDSASNSGGFPSRKRVFRNLLGDWRRYCSFRLNIDGRLALCGRRFEVDAHEALGDDPATENRQPDRRMVSCILFISDDREEIVNCLKEFDA